MKVILSCLFLFSHAQDPASSDSEGGGPKVGSVKSHLRNRGHYFRFFFLFYSCAVYLKQSILLSQDEKRREFSFHFSGRASKDG